MQKWQSLFGADEMGSIMPLVYRAATMGRSYLKRLHTETMQSGLTNPIKKRKPNPYCKKVREEPLPTSTSTQSSGYIAIQQASTQSKGYRRLYFVPLQWQRPELRTESIGRGNTGLQPLCMRVAHEKLFDKSRRLLSQCGYRSPPGCRDE